MQYRTSLAGRSSVLPLRVCPPLHRYTRATSLAHRPSALVVSPAHAQLLDLFYYGSAQCRKQERAFHTQHLCSHCLLAARTRSDFDRGHKDPKALCPLSGSAPWVADVVSRLADKRLYATRMQHVSLAVIHLLMMIILPSAKQQCSAEVTPGISTFWQAITHCGLPK